MPQKTTYEALVQELAELKLALLEATLNNQKIIQSRDRVQFISDNAPAYMGYIGADDLCYKFVNRQFEIAFNRTREQIVGQHVKTLIGEENFVFAQPYIEQVRAGMAVSYENIFTIAAGKRWVKVNYTPDFDASGKVVGIVALSYDISEQKNAEEALIKTQAKLLESQQIARVGWWEFEVETQKIVWSDEVYEMYGLSHADDPLEYQRVLALIDRQHLERFRSQARQLLGSGSGEFEYAIQRPDGQLRWIWARGNRTSNAACTLTLLHGVTQDITERKRLEEEKRVLEAQLHQSQKMEALGTLAGGIAHEFNNILAIMQGYTELALRKLAPEDDAWNYLKTVHSSGQRAVNLVTQILTFSRMDTSHFEILDPILLIKDSLNLLKVTIPANIPIIVSLPEVGGKIKGDAAQLHQVLVNLVNNAFQAVEPTQGQIELIAQTLDAADSPLGGATEQPNQGAFQLTVRDNGVGISKAHLKQIFDPFFTTKGVGKGTGLGLAVVHAIVEKHQGAITVDSEVGRGTSMNLFFPLVEDATRQTLVKEAERDPHAGKGRILIVDDEPTIAQLYQKFLESLDYQVTSCHDARQALKLFDDDPQRFDLVLTDMAMPQMTGKQLATELLQRRAGLPIILSSGYSHTISEEEALAMGARAYLMKPVSLVTLSKVIAECLRKDS